MNTLYERIQELCDTRGITGGKLCSDISVRRSLLSDLKMERKKTLSAETLSKISEYFNVSIDYLLGNEQKKEAPAKADAISRKDIKFAVFGDPDVDDDLMEDVMNFAKYIKEQREQKGK